MRSPAAHRSSPFVHLSLAAHVAGLGVLALAPSLWPWLLSLAVSDHVALLLGGLLPRSRILGPNLDRVPPNRLPSDQVVLTFDDGPDPGTTPVVLDLLERHRATASFFCIGRRAAEHPDLVAEIAARGHTVENHTWRHPRAFSFLPPGALTREIERAQDLLHRLSGRRPRYFRAPAGIRSPWLQCSLQQLELELVSWTRRAFDTRVRTPEHIADTLLRDVSARDVLLLHDGSSSHMADGFPTVLRALPMVLDGIAQRGLEAVRLP